MANPLKIKVINQSHHALPEYATDFSAGVDLRAFIEKSILLEPFQRVIVPTGLFIELPKGYEAQIRPRSGLAIKYGITVLNSPGTIDADYRGEIKIILINLSQSEFLITDGERICQMVVAKHETVQFELVSELEQSERGEGGFGSTGKK